MLSKYTLYHSTDAAAAASIMAGGFAGEEVYFANMPWKIGVHGADVTGVSSHLWLERSNSQTPNEGTRRTSVAAVGRMPSRLTYEAFNCVCRFADHSVRSFSKSCRCSSA